MERERIIEALKICDANYDGVVCKKCPIKDEDYNGSWCDKDGDCYQHLMREAAELLSDQPTIQPVATDANVGDTISKFIDGLEEIFADIRERHVDDSVCGLCEYDGAYIGQSGDWCNECPGFNRDDCFKLSDKIRKKWTDEIIKALPTIQPEPHWIPVSERLPEEKDAGILKKFGTEKKSEYVLATVEVKGERMTVTACTYDGKWDWNMKYAFPDFKVIAWMPLPEPYTK